MSLNVCDSIYCLMRVISAPVEIRQNVYIKHVDNYPLEVTNRVKYTGCIAHVLDVLTQ